MTSKLPVPERTPTPNELRRFVARCHRREYWLAHEELEPLWLDTREDAYKALIHLAAGLLHAERGNRRGARTKLASALRLLDEEVPPALARLRVQQLCADLASWLDALAGDGKLPSIDVADYFPDTLREETVEAVRLPYRVTRYEEGYRPWRSTDLSDSPDDGS